MGLPCCTTSTGSVCTAPDTRCSGGPLIDDMESGTGQLCQDRLGLWYTYVDTDSTSSTITPVPDTPALPELMSTPRTTTNSRPMHIAGYYYTYASLACWLNNGSFDTIPGAYNGSSYQGIKFCAKGKSSLIVVGQTPSTQKAIYGGTCPYTDCWGNQYTVGALSSSWTLYTIPFSYLTDGSTEPFDPRSIWSLEFMFYSYAEVSTSFDLWIDDLTFY